MTTTTTTRAPAGTLGLAWPVESGPGVGDQASAARRAATTSQPCCACQNIRVCVASHAGVAGRGLVETGGVTKTTEEERPRRAPGRSSGHPPSLACLRCGQCSQLSHRRLPLLSSVLSHGAVHSSRVRPPSRFFQWLDQTKTRPDQLAFFSGSFPVVQQCRDQPAGAALCPRMAGWLAPCCTYQT